MVIGYLLREPYVRLHQLKYVMYLLLFFISPVVFAKVYIIDGKTVIDQNTVYQDAIIDMRNGYFQVINHATLKIENCIIKGVISPNNTQLFDIKLGQLTLINNVVDVASMNIPKHGDRYSGYYLIMINAGKVRITVNKFNVDVPYTVGFLNSMQHNGAFHISKNELNQFHGGVLLSNAHQIYIGYNQFSKVSMSNILIAASHNIKIEKNNIVFAGHHQPGDAIDVFDSHDVLIENNYIGTGSCYSIVILRSHDITVNNNIIVGGITHAIYINTSFGFFDIEQVLNIPHDNKRSQQFDNKNIKITNNYIAQNRYGLVAVNTDSLVVMNNKFIQLFNNDSDRQFWTDNRHFLINVINIIWDNNKYKEAFVQDFSNNERYSKKFVEFPLYGGVRL